MAKTYKGVAPLSLVPTSDGSGLLYVYADQPVPSGADTARVRELVKDGYLAELGSDDPVDASSGGQGGGVVAAPEGTPAANTAAKGK